MNLILEGLTLMLVGMGTVFIFLSLLVIVVNTCSKTINRFWPETPEIVSPPNTNDDATLIAVISSAIQQYKKKR